jgi:hypothetical protein
MACRGRVIIFRMSENTATPRTLDKPIAAWKTPEARDDEATGLRKHQARWGRSARVVEAGEQRRGERRI